MMVFVLRVHGDPMVLANSARGVIRDLDSAQPVADIAPMQTVISETFARQRFSAILLIGFSVIAVVLAAIGIYGVLAYSVAERTREIGIRMALGADARRVVAMVAAGGARVVGLGTVAGLAGAFLLTGLLKSMLFGVEPHDVVTFVAVPCVLGLVAMIAAYLPARRASQVAPADALRSD
jgi:ABC-type antimicrobial peptide transport system permease subunit